MNKNYEDEIFELKQRYKLLIYPNGVGKDDIPYQLKLLRLIDDAYGEDDTWAQRHIAYMNENHKKE